MSEKKPKLPDGKLTKTDLGIIMVFTRGQKDRVFLTHNKLKIFTLKCPTGRPSQVVINHLFYSYEARQWDEVFHAYLTWKRKVMPDFKLPSHSGRRGDGKSHPWRWHKPGVKHEPKEFQEGEDL